MCYHQEKGLYRRLRRHAAFAARRQAERPAGSGFREHFVSERKMAMSADCVFCRIVRGEIPARKVFENEYVLAFHDIQPQAPVHVLVIPKKHIPSWNELTKDDAPLVAEVALGAQAVARELGLAESGYRLINNCGPDAGQVVFHLHVHVLGGEKLSGLNPK